MTPEGHETEAGNIQGPNGLGPVGPQQRNPHLNKVLPAKPSRMTKYSTNRMIILDLSVRPTRCRPT